VLLLFLLLLPPPLLLLQPFCLALFCILQKHLLCFQ
jgi:hypothetical protein